MHHAFLRKLDLTSLRLFMAVCRHRSIARAAEEACIVPSAVSRRIGDLEKAIGLPLLFRSPSGVSPTAAGETVLAYAGQALDRLEELGAALSPYSAELKGTVRLVANLSSIDLYLPEDIAAFCRAYPDVIVDIDEKLSQDIVKAIETGKADLGIGNDWYLQRAPVVSREYRRDEFVLVVPTDHPLRSAASTRFADILDEPLLGLHADSAYNAKLAEYAALHNRQLRLKIRVTSFDALCRMVHARLGIAIVPRQLAETYVGLLGITIVPLTDDWAKKTILVAYRSEGTLSATARTLLNFLTRDNPPD